MRMTKVARGNYEICSTMVKAELAASRVVPSDKGCQGKLRDLLYNGESRAGGFKGGSK